VEHYKEGQYDDDLTAGIDEYDGDFDTGGVDLFDYVGDEESPLARLKSIILSIDWEINDDILRQFNEELEDLEDIWAGNKIHLIYVQALAKISRYIYKEKASSHPSAIKLLLTFYTNLEKIVSDEEMSEKEKKNLLRTDIARFEKLKEQIAAAAGPAKPSPAREPKPVAVEIEESPVEIEDDFTEAATSDAIIPSRDEVFGQPGEEDPLLNLKAIVYGIDWEITERDLNNLAREVKRLEKEFITSRVKQIFLQGIGSLGAYINAKRSDAHADAFKLLHTFYSGLEKVVREDLSGQAEKNVLLPEVEKFNAFKATIADTISPDSMTKSKAKEEKEEYDDSYEEIQPAFADVPEDVHGFQEEQEAATLEKKEQEDAVDEFFEDDEDEPQQPEEDSQLSSEMEFRLEGMFDVPEQDAALSLDADVALKGVDVESEADDDSDEEPLPEEDGELSPALAAEAPPEEESPAVYTEKVEEFFKEPEEEEAAEHEAGGVPGVDVEHEADDDSLEEPLRFEEDGEYAPALSGDDDDLQEENESGGFPEVEDTLDTFFGEDDEGAVDEKAANLEELGGQEPIDKEASDIEERLTDFFGESEAETVGEVDEDALQGVAVETAEDDDSEEEPLPYEDGELAPALAEEEDEVVVAGEEPATDEIDAPAAEEDEVEEAFDDIFGEKEETVAEEEDVFTFDDEPEAGEEEALQGVDVETPEDDESEEESLALEEDGELAPALGEGDEEEFLAEDDEDEAAETEVGDRFDSFFGEEEQESGEQELSAFEEHLPVEVEEAEVPQKAELEKSVEDTLFFEEEPAEEEPVEEEPAEEEPVEEEPKPLPSEEDEIMALLGDEEDMEDTFADTAEEEIPEMSADDLGVVIADDDSIVKTAGKVPSGYPSNDELLREFGEVAGEDTDGITHPEGNEDFIIGVGDDEEEEVVFEPVAEEVEAGADFDSLSEEAQTTEEAAEDRIVFDQDDDYDDADFFGTTLLANEPKIKKPEEATEKTAPEPVTAADETADEERRGYVERPMETSTEDALTGLRNCIVSLGLEIDDAILDSLSAEVEKLRVAWRDRPAEKTFIQLLSTITSHIERYRYEADADANRLLLSVFDKLELSALGKAESVEIQEAMLNETSKVLQWQSRLIDRSSAAAFTEKATAADSLVPETIVETEEKISAGLDDMSKKVDEIGNDMLMQKVSTIMKSEMEQLKAAFHDELRELREELMRRK